MGTTGQATALGRIAAAGLVPVVRAPDAAGAVAAARALVDGGVTVIEIAFTTPSAEAAIAEVAAVHGDRVCIGAGTVLTPDMADAAAAAGAEFLVSPGLGHELVLAASRLGRPILPGVFTPSEVMQASGYGITAVKLFPGSLGGPAHLAALRAPFPELAFMPTGGVGVDNVSDWFAAGAFAVGAGGDLCSAALIKAQRFDAITERARRFVDAVAVARP